MSDSSISYRDFIDPTEPMYLSDWVILEELGDADHLSPSELARSRFRENVIRLQLRDLRRVGLVDEYAHDTFQLATRGRVALADKSQVPATEEMIDVRSVRPEAFPDPKDCLTDFSNLDGETIKQINFDIIEDSSEEYGWIQGSPDVTRRRINNVPDTDLHRLMREFPTHDPLPQQCAHWLRAIAGLHFFPDANHRTAMSSLSVLYETNTGSPLPVGENIERVVLESKLARYLLSDIKFDTLWVRDPLYDVWHRYFRQVLCGDGARRHHPPTHHLRLILNYARRIN